MHSELKKRVAAAIFDPGATEGFKGERTLTEWQTDAVMRVLSALPQEPSSASMGVVVRALEWRPPIACFHEADGFGGTIQILDCLRYREPGNWVLYPNTNERRKFDTLEDAKAAAQADFEQRVRSCLSAAPSPSPAPGVVEAKKLLRDMAAMRFGCSGMTLIQVNDWFNEQAIAALASLSQPAKGEREGGGA